MEIKQVQGQKQRPVKINLWMLHRSRGGDANAKSRTRNNKSPCHSAPSSYKDTLIYWGSVSTRTSALCLCRPRFFLEKQSSARSFPVGNNNPKGDTVQPWTTPCCGIEPVNHCLVWNTTRLWRAFGVCSIVLFLLMTWIDLRDSVVSCSTYYTLC